jgi:hypothetical protein
LLNLFKFIYQNVLDKIQNSHQMRPCNSKPKLYITRTQSDTQLPQF